VLLRSDGERRGACSFILTYETLLFFDFLSTPRVPHVQFLLKTSHQKRDASYFRHTRLSDRVLSVPFPEAPPELIAPDIRQIVYSHLPPYEDARGACELFLNYSSYMYVVLVSLRVNTSFYTSRRSAQDLFLNEGGDIAHSRHCISKKVRTKPFLFPDVFGLLRFLAGGQTLSP
jgi:hypothetical protein